MEVERGEEEGEDEEEEGEGEEDSEVSPPLNFGMKEGVDVCRTNLAGKRQVGVS